MILTDYIKQSYLMAHNGRYKYGDSKSAPPCMSDRTISCDRLGALALWLAGFHDQPAGGITVYNMDAWLTAHGFSKNTNPDNVRAGHIVLMKHNSTSTFHWLWHAFYCCGFRNVNDIDKYDMGAQWRIDSAQPFRNVPLNQWADRTFYASYYLDESVPLLWVKIQGDNRYSTAANATLRVFDKQESVILVSGQNWPDALTAFCYAKAHDDAPVLITNNNFLSAETANIIKLWGTVKSVTIIGGVIGEKVETDLKELGVERINRIAGMNRVKTAEAVASAAINLGVGECCAICSGNNPADALSISPWAYRNKIPVLLTDYSGNLSKESRQIAKGFSYVYVIGGNNVVKQSSIDDLPFCRLSGADRYRTSLNIAKHFVKDTPAGACIVRGETQYFADALAAGTLAAYSSSPVLLTTRNNIALTDYLKSAGKPTKGYIMGSVANDPFIMSAIHNAII